MITTIARSLTSIAIARSDGAPKIRRSARPKRSRRIGRGCGAQTMVSQPITRASSTTGTASWPVPNTNSRGGELVLVTGVGAGGGDPRCPGAGAPPAARDIALVTAGGKSTAADRAGDPAILGQQHPCSGAPVRRAVDANDGGEQVGFAGPAK